MKKMKKTAAMLMAATVAVAMPMTAMAASITVENAVQGEVYKAYKIFDYTNSGDNYSYTISANSEWKDAVESFEVDGSQYFTLTASKDNENVLVVETPKDEDGNYVAMTDGQAEYFAAHLAKNTTDKTSIPSEGATVGGDKKVDFGNLTPGYYFVDTTTGSVCSLFNSDSTQVLKEKNTLPEVKKKVLNKEGLASDHTTATIGDIVTYEITVTDKKGTDKAITVHDRMDSGLELLIDNNDYPFTVKLANGRDVESTKYEVKTGADVSETGSGECTFEVVLSDALVSGLNENDTVVISYSAKVTKEALENENGTSNSAEITYSNSKIPDKVDDPKVYTYGFDLVKTDKDNKLLENAKFKLYSDSDLSKEIKVVTKGSGYRVAEEGETGVEIEVGNKTIKGLGNGIYYLVETEAPTGYNPLTEAKKIEIADGNKFATLNDNGTYKEGGLQVINYTGTILPSTGGIGTTVFYAAGIVVMAGAVFFVVRSKKHE